MRRHGSLTTLLLVSVAFLLPVPAGRLRAAEKPTPRPLRRVTLVQVVIPAAILVQGLGEDLLVEAKRRGDFELVDARKEGFPFERLKTAPFSPDAVGFRSEHPADLHLGVMMLGCGSTQQSEERPQGGQMRRFYFVRTLCKAGIELLDGKDGSVVARFVAQGSGSTTPTQDPLSGVDAVPAAHRDAAFDAAKQIASHLSKRP